MSLHMWVFPCWELELVIYIFLFGAWTRAWTWHWTKHANSANSQFCGVCGLAGAGSHLTETNARASALTAEQNSAANGRSAAVDSLSLSQIKILLKIVKNLEIGHLHLDMVEDTGGAPLQVPSVFVSLNPKSLSQKQRQNVTNRNLRSAWPCIACHATVHDDDDDDNPT